MAINFPPGSYTPEKPFTDTAGVKWVVWRDGAVDGDWYATPVSPSNPYNYPAFATDGYKGVGPVSSSKAALAAINKRAVSRIAAQANERNPSGGSALLWFVLGAFILFGKKGR